MEVRIRLATSGDVPALERLIAESVRELSKPYYSPEEIERALVHVFGVDTQLVEDGTYYVAEAAGRLAGCGGWSRRRTLYGGDRAKSADDPLLDPAVDPARVRAFFVHPDFARRGIGSRILRLCEDAARCAGFARAELGATLPGQPLYAALGYAPLEELSVDLRDGFALRVIRMGKQL